MTKYVLLEDFDNNWIEEVKNEQGDVIDFQLNVRKIPLHLWNKASDGKHAVVTIRHTAEYAKLVFSRNFISVALKHWIPHMKKLGIDVDQVVTYFDPIEEKYFEKKIEPLEAYIESTLHPTLLKVDKNLSPQNLAENESYKEFLKKQKEEHARVIEKFTSGSYSDANKHKEEELRYICNEYSRQFPGEEIKFIFIDDSRTIIAGLLEHKNGDLKEKNLEFLEHIIPILYDKAKDIQNTWQHTIAIKLGLDAAANEVVRGKSLDQINCNDLSRLAILLYLHQNKKAFRLSAEELKHLQSETEKFAKKIAANPSLVPMTNEMRIFVGQQLGINFSLAQVAVMGRGFFNAATNTSVFMNGTGSEEAIAQKENIRNTAEENTQGNNLHEQQRPQFWTKLFG